MEALGAGLAVEPYLATAVLGASLLRQGGAVQHEQLSRLAAGELQVAFGFAASGSPATSSRAWRPGPSRTGETASGLPERRVSCSTPRPRTSSR